MVAVFQGSSKTKRDEFVSIYRRQKINHECKRENRYDGANFNTTKSYVIKENMGCTSSFGDC